MNTKRKIISSITILLAILIFAWTPAAAATLEWNTSSGTVEGYNVYYSTSATTPGNLIDVGNTAQFDIDTLSLTENVQYYFCVSAYNTAGESNPCSPVAYTPADTTPPTPPVGLIAE